MSSIYEDFVAEKEQLINDIWNIDAKKLESDHKNLIEIEVVT